MLFPEYRFVELVTDRITNRGNVVELKSVESLLAKSSKQECYRSFYRHPEEFKEYVAANGTVSGWAGPVYTDYLWFDIDSHDLEEALIMGTRLLVLSQYWEKGNELGAKIVKDVKLDWGDKPLKELVNDPEFNELKREIQFEGLKSDVLQSLDEFDLSHEDSMIDHNFKL